MAKQQKAFFFDAGACTGCKACQIACKDRSSLPVGIKWRRVYHYSGGRWERHPTQPNVMVPNDIFVYSLSLACMHCENPVCMEVCPAKAISKREDGIVSINQDQCIGCRYCQWSCPYSAPQFDEEMGVMTKCDFCADLQDQGLNPACVDACVMRCLKSGNLEDLKKQYGSFEVEPLPSSGITRPAFVVRPHKSSQKTGTGTGKIINLPEEV